VVELLAGAAWSDAVGEAAWIGERLAPFDAHQVTSVVPGGFAAYARVLHPAEEPGWGDDRLVRWAEVAAWSGTPLRPDAQFHTVALPLLRPEREAPWSSQGPREGSLYPPDAEALAGIVREWTSTPGRCWFCVWDGHGWGGTLLTPAGEPSVPLPDPVPEPVRRGPRVHLPERDYLLYTGPAEAVLAAGPLSGDDQTANLWWPADRAWCVASEIDLAWTYVGGPAGLIERVLADGRIEALPAEPGDPLTRVEDWVTHWVEEATARLLASGETIITTSRGTVHAWLERPAWPRRPLLRTHSSGDNEVSGSTKGTLSHAGGEELRDEIGLHLTCAVIGLVDG
jgi:hypothetical protein